MLPKFLQAAAYIFLYLLLMTLNTSKYIWYLTIKDGGKTNLLYITHWKCSHQRMLRTHVYIYIYIYIYLDESKVWQYFVNVKYNWTASDGFADVMKMMNSTGLWDAKLIIWKNGIDKMSMHLPNLYAACRVWHKVKF